MPEFRSVMDPSEFLNQFVVSDLQAEDVLNGKRRLLNGRSVEPLLRLMRENGVQTLESGRWFISTDGTFCNPDAKDTSYRQGSVALRPDVRNGVVFEGQNTKINPHYAPRDVATTEPTATISYDQSIFINEVVSAPENRVNLNLFGLLNIAEFRQWFYERLDLPAEAVLFPTKNVAESDADGRPDYEILDQSGAFLAYVEVELGGENHEQLARYRVMASAREGRLISIVGRTKWGGALSLEEILETVQRIREEAHPQVAKYCNAFEAMYCEYVLGRGSSTSYPVAEVSNQMREHRFVTALCEHLPVTFDISGPMTPGEFRMNTRKEKGMSMRIHSRESSSNSIAVASISGGRNRVIFPSREKLLAYLPAEKQDAIESFAETIATMGYDIRPLRLRQQARVPLEIVMKHIEPLAAAIRALGVA